MFKTVEYAGWGATAFFVMWVIVGKYTFLTLFLAVTMEAFEVGPRPCQMEPGTRHPHTFEPSFLELNSMM